MENLCLFHLVVFRWADLASRSKVSTYHISNQSEWLSGGHMTQAKPMKFSHETFSKMSKETALPFYQGYYTSKIKV